MSAGGFLDACGFIPVSSGTGSFVDSAAVVGYQRLGAAGAVNALVYSYRAESADKSQWEQGFGAATVSAGTWTLARTTITANSSGAATAIAFSSAPNVYITAASADLQNASLLATATVATARLGSGTASSTTALFGDQTYKSMATIATSGSASDLSGGTVPTVRLGSGTASSTTALFGDQTYKTISGLSSKVISITRVLSAAAGNVSYTGVGFQPTTCEFITMAGVNNNILSISMGFSDSSKAAFGVGELYQNVNDGSISTQSNTRNGAFAIYAADGNASVVFSAYQTAVIASYDSDGFTLTWAKTGAPTSTATIIVRCLK